VVATTATTTELGDRVVLVTGTGSGIGRATAVLAARAGATVIATDVLGHESVVEEIAAEGGSAEAYELDITSAEEWGAVVERVIAGHGRIDGLANIAGIVTDTDGLLTQTEEGWDRILRVNLKGAFLGMRAVVPHMVSAGGGKIVNVSSVAGLIGMPNVVAYSAAKGGIIAMSRQVAIEYAAQNILVNVIAPGVTQTGQLSDITEELLTMVKAATPVGRVADPEDQANSIVYLLSPRSDFITGQVLASDGGWTAQ
jgi:NAD(P)-dependent dehydrogenase (short-subunit alcohol dehydrogenase family)